MEFEDPQTQCEDFLASRREPSTILAEDAPPPQDPLPAQTPETLARFWSGHALGSEELLSLLADVPPHLVVVAGLADAGKTCLLTAQFMEIAAGRAGGFPYRFCASRTLRGYEQLADSAWTWSGDLSEPIVPRTTSGHHREPSFLHLAFKARQHDGSRAVRTAIRNVLLTDMPGEWFQKWMSRASFREELPFLKRADSFWLVLDAQRALDRKQRRYAENLLRRVLDEASDGRPVAVVLTKMDSLQLLDPLIWKRAERFGKNLLKQLNRHPGRAEVFFTAAFPSSEEPSSSNGVLAPLKFSLSSNEYATRAHPVDVKERYFSLFREYV